MFASFNRFEIEMTRKQAAGASHSGACDDDVAALLLIPRIKRQLAAIPDDTLAAELQEYGAWDEKELESRTDNEARIVWIAAGDIMENVRESSILRANIR
jgi:hypothetical protein